MLHIEDLDDLLHLLDDVSASWKDIVTQLGLSQGDVEAIAYEKGDSPIDCLRESLILWLRGVDPAPTREQLARVLLSPLIGKEEIAQQVLYGKFLAISLAVPFCWLSLCIVRPCSLLYPTPKCHNYCDGVLDEYYYVYWQCRL